jgi:hypothetical protein
MRALFLFLVIVAALMGASYAGARLAAGQVMGPNPQMGPLTTEFAWGGISSLPGEPRGWIMAYPQAGVFGPDGAEIYVSITGKVLGTWPEDLADQMEARQSAEP